MKKTLLFIFILAITFVNAQLLGVTSTNTDELNENFDSYTLGDISSQASHWRTWSGAEGTGEEGEVSTDIAVSGTQSLKIHNVGAPAGIDMLLLVASQPSSGKYSVQWEMFIPNGNEAYFNAQGTITEPQDNTLFGGNVYFNKDGFSPGQGEVDGTPGTTFTFEHDVWFTVTCVYDFDTTLWQMYINGEQKITDQEFTFNDPQQTSLGGIDFYAPSSATLYYVDDLKLATGDLTTASVQDLQELGFSAYPNPVKNNLFLNANENITNVSIYNVIGQQVKSVQPNSLETTINMSDLSSGAYFVKVNIGSTVGTIKVMK